jgi:two-component system nitrogen regulation sensor histidine kinase NtrY
MRLAPQLVLAFGFLTALSTAGLGVTLRQELRQDESERFASEVGAACQSVTSEVARQAESDRKLIVAACQSGELVDRVITWIENGDLENQRVSLGATLVPNTRQAFDLDELILASGSGDILGADPLELMGKSRAQVASLLEGSAERVSLRAATPAALVSRCKRERGGHVIGLVGARHIAPLLDRLRSTLNLSTIAIGAPAPAPPDFAAQAGCTIGDGNGAGIPIVVTKQKSELYRTLQSIDKTVLVAAAALTGAALLLAVLLARSLGRPIAELAVEAGKVATGQANPLRVRGSGEIALLVQAFDRMLEDLATTRRRLAATSRVAAWREVARRVAHEVKNPLAPIRAAVETLRRLRARGDPAFDDYFDEATRTVLDEVHRIATIVTEFTRFTRLPAPRPQGVDLEEIVRHVLALQQSGAEEIGLLHEVRGAIPTVRADRDQVVQVLVNLVQNAVEAVKGRPGARVVVRVEVTRPGFVDVTVHDNGPGVAAEIAARLFEPYATTKAEGTGLGLSIAQQIAMEHDGELSYVGKGSVDGGAIFRFVLPICGPKVASDAAQGPDSGPDSAGSSPPRRAPRIPSQ